VDERLLGLAKPVLPSEWPEAMEELAGLDVSDAGQARDKWSSEALAHDPRKHDKDSLLRGSGNRVAFGAEKLGTFRTFQIDPDNHMNRRRRRGETHRKRSRSRSGVIPAGKGGGSEIVRRVSTDDGGKGRADSAVKPQRTARSGAAGPASDEMTASTASKGRARRKKPAKTDRGSESPPKAATPASSRKIKAGGGSASERALAEDAPKSVAPGGKVRRLSGSFRRHAKRRAGK
jgi:hypothetical protein